MDRGVTPGVRLGKGETEMVNNFGKELRKLRIDRDESLRAMADKLHVTASYLCAVENGRRNMPPHWERAIVELYQLSPSAAARLHNAVISSARQLTIDLSDASPAKRELAHELVDYLQGADDDALGRLRSLIG